MKENRGDTFWDELSITIKIAAESARRVNQAMENLLFALAVRTWKRRAAALIFVLSMLIVLLRGHYG
jgi:hypothetical protein